MKESSLLMIINKQTEFERLQPTHDYKQVNRI